MLTRIVRAGYLLNPSLPSPKSQTRPISLLRRAPPSADSEPFGTPLMAAIAHHRAHSQIVCHESYISLEDFETLYDTAMRTTPLNGL